MQQVILLFILSIFLDNNAAQIVLNPNTDDAGKLPNGLLVFIPSDDKCQTGKLTDVIRLQRLFSQCKLFDLDEEGYYNTIVDLREKITNITGECPVTTKITPLGPTLPPKPTGQCSRMVNDLFKTSKQLEILKVSRTKADHELDGLKVEYEKHKQISTDSCLKSFDAIGEAEIVYQDNNLGSTGTWIQDPTSDDDKIWIAKGHSSNSQVLEYKSIDALKSGASPVIYNLPYSCGGMGHVVYKGSLYCVKYGSSVLAKYDLKTSQTYAVTLSGAYSNTHSYGHYQADYYNNIDLAVDENGLWVIFGESSTGSRYLSFSKLDPDNLSQLQTWRTGVVKETVGEAFIVCGKLYALYSYNSASNYISYMFDSVTYQSKSLSIPFHTYSKDHYISSLDYNPKNRKLYVWHYQSLSLARYSLLSNFQ